jgi:probable rRNA maturation factor
MRMSAQPPRAESRASSRVAQPTLSLSLQLGARIREWPIARARLRRWAQIALERDATLTMRLVARAEAIELNKAYRGRDYAPNVLTFEYGDQPGSPDSGPRCTADIILCLPVLRAEARAQHKPLIDHLAHLVIHGVLHAQGYDHQDERDAARMEALETRLLARLRIADPYALRRPAN